MKIGIVTPDYPPYTAGGISTSTRALVRNMAIAGHEIDVFAVFALAYDARNKLRNKSLRTDENVTVHYISSNVGNNADCDRIYRELRRDLSLANAWVLDKKLSEFIKERPLDVIIAADYRGLLSYFLLRERALPFHLRTPSIVILHSSQKIFNHTDLLSIKNVPYYQRDVVDLEQVSIDLVTTLISPSSYIAEFYKEYIGLDREIVTLPNFPSFMETAAIRDYNPTESGERKILYLGSIQRRKGIKEFVLAAVLMLRRKRDYRFILIGDNTWFDSISQEVYSRLVKRLIPKEFSDRFEFYGSIPHDRLPDLIRSCDAAVIPSLFENYPNTCMEAVQMGIPALVSIHGGMKEIVGEDEETIFDPYDIAGMAEKIDGFLNLPIETRRGLIARQRRFFIEKHDVGRLTIEYEKIFEDTIAKHRKAAHKPPKKYRIGVGIYNDSDENLIENIGCMLSQTRLPDRISILTEREVSSGITGSTTVPIEIIHRDTIGGSFSWSAVIDSLWDMDFILLPAPDERVYPDYLFRTEEFMINNPEISAVMTWGEERGGLNLPLRFGFPELLLPETLRSNTGLVRMDSITGRPLPGESEDIEIWYWDFWISLVERGKTSIIPQTLCYRKTGRHSNVNRIKHAAEVVMNRHPKTYQKYLSDLILYSIDGKNEFLNNLRQRLITAVPGWLRLGAARSELLKKILAGLLNK